MRRREPAVPAEPLVPAEGEPWRAVIAEADVTADLVASLVRAARWVGTPGPRLLPVPPVHCVEHGYRSWQLLRDGAALEPVEALDIVDAWLAAPPGAPGARGWCWGLVLGRYVADR